MATQSTADRLKLAQAYYEAVLRDVEREKLAQAVPPAQAPAAPAAAPAPTQVPVAPAAAPVPTPAVWDLWGAVRDTWNAWSVMRKYIAVFLVIAAYWTLSAVTISVCVNTRISEYRQLKIDKPKSPIPDIPIGCAAVDSACFMPVCAANWWGEVIDLFVWPVLVFINGRLKAIVGVTSDIPEQITDLLLLRMVQSITAVIGLCLPVGGKKLLYGMFNNIATRQQEHATALRTAQDGRDKSMLDAEHKVQLANYNARVNFVNDIRAGFSVGALSLDTDSQKPAPSTTAPVPIVAAAVTAAAVAPTSVAAVASAVPAPAIAASAPPLAGVYAAPSSDGFVKQLTDWASSQPLHQQQEQWQQFQQWQQQHQQQQQQQQQHDQTQAALYARREEISRLRREAAIRERRNESNARKPRAGLRAFEDM